MRQWVISIVKRTMLYAALIRWRQKRKLIIWENSGKPAPPPHLVKQRAIRDIAKRYGYSAFVETGTFHGDMVEAMRTHFRTIVSIELSQDLYVTAAKRFAGDERITIVHGDSGVELGNVLADMTEPAILWLDGHYSSGETARGNKDTPIFEELSHVFRNPDRRHVVIIDDARCFGSDPNYPSLHDLRAFVEKNRPGAQMEIENDSIRIYPQETGQQAKQSSTQM